MDQSADRSSTQLEYLRQMIVRVLSDTHVSMPAIIESFNDGTQEIECVPVIRRRIYDSEGNSMLEDMPKLIKVPLITPYVRMLGFSMTMPIAPGDTCILHFADRGVDNWQETGAISDPPDDNRPRQHHLTDAFATLAPIALPDSIVDYQTETAELRNRDRTTAVEIAEDWSELRATPGNYTTWTDGGDITSFAPGDIEERAIFNIDMTAGVSIEMIAGVSISSETPGSISENAGTTISEIAGTSISQAAPAIIDTASATHTVTAPTQTANATSRTVTATASYTLNTVLATLTGTGTVAVNGGVINLTGVTAVNITAPIITLNGAVVINGALTVSGLMTGNGGISSDSMEIDGVEMAGHVHAHGDPFTGPAVEP
jgi:phage baseplate assembly protein gpV